MMSNLHKLLNQLASTEAQLLETQFLSPCVNGGKICTKVSGLVYTFTPQPQHFEGWGIFRPLNGRTATLVDVADLSQIASYLQHLPAIRLRLAYRLQNQSWLAYPVNEADMQQRFAKVKPVPVHLVTEGSAFEQILARWNRGFCWFEEVDRRDELAIAEALDAALTNLTPADSLRFKGLTPEMRSLYELVTQQRAEFSQPQQDERRLRQALHLGGGMLHHFHDRGDYWTVDWTTSDGVRHSSAIAKTDLTVVSAGICLSGYDQEFDLQSLVGVVEQWDR